MMQAKNEAIAEQKLEQKNRRIIRRIKKNRNPENMNGIFSAARSNSPPFIVNSGLNSQVNS